MEAKTAIEIQISLLELGPLRVVSLINEREIEPSPLSGAKK